MKDRYTALISTAELAANLGHPDWVVVDCRFDMANPEDGYAQYRKAHVLGAVYAHLNRDLSGPLTPTSGRHPLPEAAALFATFSRLGIGADTQVVLYDSSGGSYAGRLWWLLRLYGHNAAAVLNGGFPKWLAENRPLAAGEEQNPARVFQGSLRPEMLADEDDVRRAAADPTARLVDARAPERYRGEVEPIDAVAGHIPGAVNRPYGLNLDQNGLMKSPEELRREFEGLLDGADPREAIVYCGSGVTATHHLLAMEAAGLPGARLYAGSWSQWIRDPRRPIARGDEA
jgi:thiosulfate/3-mercaptopyruvate sulfurtransferase